jgi:phage tail-like protein
VDLPLLASRFLVRIGDREVAVSEVRGLGLTPGLEPPVAVTLRRAASVDRTFLEWAVRPRPQEVHVALFDQAGEPTMSYLLEGARPTAWHGPELVATSAEIALEELVLAADRIDLR